MAVVLLSGERQIGRLDVKVVEEIQPSMPQYTFV